MGGEIRSTEQSDIEAAYNVPDRVVLCINLHQWIGANGSLWTIIEAANNVNKEAN